MLRLVQQQFIFDDPIPVPECHASTILKAGDGSLVAAWFGGTKEANPDVMIWSSRQEKGRWSAPRCITEEAGVQHWNPVLMGLPDGRIQLFYKLGYPISAWRTMLLESADFGQTWKGLGEMVPGDVSGGRGPVKNKVIRLSSGRWLAPGSVETLPWRCFVDASDDGVTWTKHEILYEGEMADQTNMIQPTLWESAPGRVHALMRSNRGVLFRADSQDSGETWSTAYPTAFPNNNSGLDCVRLEDGRVALLCNPVGKDWGVRTPLSVFVSSDNAQTFEHVLDLETERDAGEFSYPAVIRDGSHLYITYTWKRKKIVFAELADEP